MRPIQFIPLCQERVWGGRWIGEKFGRDLPGEGPIGESWEIVDRPEAQSVDLDTGMTLRELLRRHPEEIMGPAYDPETPFPILVKWLDCSDRLSLQVHPPPDVAARLAGEPKTECWYIADTTPHAALIVGLRHGVTRAQFEQGIADETLEPLLHRFPVEPGDAMLLPSGRLHAIDAGNLILEIQQNSDTTYRVYDWGRKGLDGKPRELHVEQSLASIDFRDFEPPVTKAESQPGETVLAECPEFRMRQCNARTGEPVYSEAGQPRILSLVQGELTNTQTGERYAAGANVLLPASWTGRFSATTESTILMTDRFA